MNILILNPNMSTDMTEGLVQAASQVAASETVLIPATASRGFPYISSRAEAQIAGEIVLEVIAEHIANIDAVVIAAFGDPGLHAARELFDIPVIGMAEAAMYNACFLGERFAYVTFSRHLASWYEAGVQQAGLLPRFAGVHTPTENMGAISQVQSDLRAPLIALVERAATQASADVVILAGAPLAGMANTIEDSAAVLLDPISTAVCQAESLVRLAPLGANRGRFRRPPGKPATGLAVPLAQWIARPDEA
ncbi:MAG: aspartate/glutamate racemase family protein [Burkholderiaceae bacterium]